MAELAEVMERSAGWLLENRDEQTGGWADQPGKPVSTLNTAEAIIALLDGNIIAPGDKRIQQGIKFLLEHQWKDGPDKGAWPREIPRDHGEPERIPDMVRTSFCG